MLASVTVTGVAATRRRRDRGEDSRRPRRAATAAYTKADDQQYAADQPLTNGTTLRLQLVFDQAAIYGWLVSSVQPG